MANLAVAAAAAAAARDPAVDRSLRSVFGKCEEIGSVCFLCVCHSDSLAAKLNLSNLQVVTTKTGLRVCTMIYDGYKSELLLVILLLFVIYMYNYR